MSLFGLTPQQVRANARFQNRANASQLGGWGMLGNKLGSLFGLKDEGQAQVQKQARIYDIRNRVISQPGFKQLQPQEKIKTLADAYLNAGEMDIASGIMTQGQAMLRSSAGQARKPLPTTTGFYSPDKGDYVRDPITNEPLMPVQASPELKQRMMQASGIGQDVAKTVAGAYESIEKITANIADLKEARRLVVEEKAATGYLASKLPTVRSSSRKLKTMQNKLGLNVVGAVTFGALSKGELDLALSTALPVELEGPELVSWIDRKVSAQEKLMANMEEAADYLSVPGNTRAGWLKEVKNRNKGVPNGIDPQDWQYMTPEEKALFR